MILLDTNVISALMLERPEPRVIQWLDLQPRISLWTTSITVFEIRSGLQVMSLGRRRTLLVAAFDRFLADILEQRVAAFDTAAAQHAADLMAVRAKQGRPGELRDTMIAGIASATRATLATRNVRHFQDIAAAVVDPWDDPTALIT